MSGVGAQDTPPGQALSVRVHEADPVQGAFRCLQCQRDCGVCQLQRLHAQQERVGAVAVEKRLLLEPGPCEGAAAGDTLAEAAIHGRFDAVERLLAASADPNSEEQFFAECAPLYWAVYYGRQRRSEGHFGWRDVEIYSRTAGAWLPGTVNSADPDTGALTVEYTASKSGLRRGLRESTAETLHGDGQAVVCAPGATKFKVITDQNSACMRRRSIVGMLLASGATPTWRHPCGGTTPLHVAAEHGNVDALKLLLDHGADPNAEDRYHATPLVCAAQCGSAECHAALLEAGADPDRKPAAGAPAADEHLYFDSLLGVRSERERRKQEILDRRAKAKAEAEAARRRQECRACLLASCALRIVDKWVQLLSEPHKEKAVEEEQDQAEEQAELEMEQTSAAAEQE